MRAFYHAYTQGVANLAQVVREMDGVYLPAPVVCLPWGHNILLVEKLSDPLQRLWYAQQTIEHGWSRALLLHQIDTAAHERQGKAITNFARTLPEPRSDLAREVLKDPYHFDFLALGPAVHAGKMNFYLSALDDLLFHAEDRPSIGLILCRRKNRVIVEYSLRDTIKPMGVASYQLRRDALPNPLRDSLPSVELIEAELGQERPEGGER